MGAGPAGGDPFRLLDQLVVRIPREERLEGDAGFQPRERCAQGDPDPAHEGKVFRPNETVTWLRPRQTASNVVKVGEEYEKYLFYRVL